MEKCQNTWKNKMDGHKHHSGAGTFYTSSAGTIVALIFLFAINLFIANNTYATASTLNLSIDNTTASIDIASVNTNGTFAQSSSSTIAASTNNITGYVLKITASDTTDNANKKLSLDSNNYLSSINSAITKSTFSSNTSSGIEYNNMWGYLPSQYYDSTNNVFISNTGDNPYFFPAPDDTGDMLGKTNTANSVDANNNNNLVPDTYTIGFGVRVDATTKVGAYSNTYIVQLVADAVPYTITYYDNVVTSLPTNASGTAEGGTTVTISSSTPVRDGYTFNGWCKVAPTINSDGIDTCPSGQSVAIGGNLSISGTSSNDFTLYAMWKDNYHISNVTTMQEFSTMSLEKKAKVVASMPTDKQYQLTDARDNKVYWVSRLKDGNVWMTQNLDLDLSSSTTLEHTKSDIGWTENKVSKTWTPATTANTIQFEGSATQSAVSGWATDNNGPYSASPYYGSSGNDVYLLPSGVDNVYDATTNLSGCTGAGKSAAECTHYKVGNFYNFAAANATNSVAGTIGHTVSNSDNYTVMPDSVCPAGWRLPHGLTAEPTKDVPSINNSEFDTLLFAYAITSYTGVPAGTDAGYGSSGLYRIRNSPLYFIRSGALYGGYLNSLGGAGYNWYNTISTQSNGYYLDFNMHAISTAYSGNRSIGFNIRCLLR